MKLKTKEIAQFALASAQPTPKANGVFAIKKARINRLASLAIDDARKAFEELEEAKEYIERYKAIIAGKENPRNVFILGGFYILPSFLPEVGPQIEELNESYSDLINKAIEIGNTEQDIDLPTFTVSDIQGVELDDQVAVIFERITDV